MALIEIVRFRLAAGADEAAWLEADKQLQREMSAGCPGMLRRTTTRGEDGEWAVFTLWRSGDDADAGSATAAERPSTGPFRAAIELGSTSSARYETLE